MTTHQDTSAEHDLVSNMRALEADHEPDGWPAVRMSTISHLCDVIERLRAALASRPAATGTEREKCLAAALLHIKYTAVSLADAQVIALEALASRDEAAQQPSLTPEVDADCRQTVIWSLMASKSWTRGYAESYVDAWLDGRAAQQTQRYQATPAQIERARDEYAIDEIQVDEDALVSHAVGGVWVQGWLWIQNEDVDANVEPT